MSTFLEQSQPQNSSIRYIRGIGPKRAEALQHLGVWSLRDLCYFFPRRYEDRSHFTPIAEIAPDSNLTIKGKIIHTAFRPTKTISIFEMMVSDETGTVIAVWFNQPYLRNKFENGATIILSGKAERYQERLQLSSPEYELIQEGDEDPVHTGRITPIYPLTEGLAQRSLRLAMRELTVKHMPDEIKEFLPHEIRNKHNLLDLKKAISEMHFPTNFQELDLARRRIVFDEFFLFQLSMRLRIQTFKKSGESISLKISPELTNQFNTLLPFELTHDQKLAIQEISKDIESTTPMNRLLQGEVGSGKTIVSAFFLYVATAHKYQAALLIPTEILAEQHYKKLKPIFDQLGISICLLTGSLEESEKRKIHQRIQKGEIDVVVGTHALLQEEVKFKNLALLVIDEQHRFGVEQRAQLLRHHPRPHLLVMSATPIPRTLGLTLYGDLDISTIHELPKNRKEIKTYWIAQDKEREVLEHIRNEIKKENVQAYIVFPIIEESEALSDVQAAAREYEKLRKGVFKGLNVGLVHGKIQKQEREKVMADFYSNKIQILVCTSVIEVGVDNPNVTFMVIHNSERFGLAQLHQIRGRIGRGTKSSSCFLFGDPTTEEGKKRLRLLTKVQDGFMIAEQDMILRGPGDFLGTKQSGIPFFQVADFFRDKELLIEARKEALNLISSDSHLEKEENKHLLHEITLRENPVKTS